MKTNAKNKTKFILKVTLKEYLETKGISVYTLTKWVDGASPQTIYAVANGTRRPSLEVLEAILTSLHFQGYNVDLNDILRLEEHQIIPVQTESE